MSLDPLVDLRRWLKVEGQDEPVVDEAFRSVFALLPRIGPPTTFADRVARAALVVKPEGIAHPWHRALLRPAVAVGLSATGLAGFWATAALPIPSSSFFVSTWASAVAGGAAWLGRTLHLGLAVWTLCGKLSDAAIAVAAAPTVSLVLLGNGMVAIGAFWGLQRLLGPREEKVSC